MVIRDIIEEIKLEMEGENIQQVRMILYFGKELEAEA